MLIAVVQNKPVLEDQRQLTDLVRPGLNVVYMFYDLDFGNGLPQDRVQMLNSAEGENAVNARIVKATVIASM